MDKGVCCEFVDCIDLCGVGVVGNWGAGSLWDLHDDVWHLPHARAAGCGGEVSAERGGAGAGGRRLDRSCVRGALGF